MAENKTKTQKIYPKAQIGCFSWLLINDFYLIGSHSAPTNASKSSKSETLQEKE